MNVNALVVQLVVFQDNAAIQRNGALVMHTAAIIGTPPTVITFELPTIRILPRVREA